MISMLFSTIVLRNPFTVASVAQSHMVPRSISTVLPLTLICMLLKYFAATTYLMLEMGTVKLYRVPPDHFLPIGWGIPEHAYCCCQCLFLPSNFSLVP